MEDNNNIKYDLTGKKIIPLNAPIAFANATPPTTLPFQPVKNGQSVAEGLCAGQGLPYYNADGTVNVNAVATTLKMMLDMYNTISQPVALLSMGAIPEWSQSVIDNNGGYPMGFIIRDYEDISGWTYYMSIIDNNISNKPTLDSHHNWSILQNIDFESDNGNSVIRFRPSTNPNQIVEILTSQDGHQIIACIDDDNFKVATISPNGVTLLENTDTLTAYYRNSGSSAPYYHADTQITSPSFINSQINKKIGQNDESFASLTDSIQVEYNGERSVTISGRHPINSVANIALPVSIDSNTAVCVVSLAPSITTSSWVDIRGAVVNNMTLQLILEAGGNITGQAVAQFIIKAQLV